MTTPTRAPSRRLQLAISARESLLLGLAVLGLMLVAADVAFGGYLTHLDDQVRDAIQPRDDSAPWWLAAPAEIGDLGLAIPIVVVVSVACAQLMARWWPVVMSFACLAAVEVLIVALKLVFGRPGPGVWADREGYPGYFPSGHTATSAVVVALASFCVINALVDGRIRRRALGLSMAAGVVVGMLTGIRAVIGDFHWASDVLGGLLLGYAVVFLALAAGRQHIASSKGSGRTA